MIYYEVSNSTSLPFLVASKQRQASAVLNCTSECMLLIVQILSYDACINDACSGELAFEVGCCRILIRNVQRALVLLPLLPSVPGQC